MFIGIEPSGNGWAAFLKKKKLPYGLVWASGMKPYKDRRAACSLDLIAAGITQINAGDNYLTAGKDRFYF